MHAIALINPFFAARCKRPAAAFRPEQAPSRQPHQPVYARLPKAPINASPVPHLTSLYHFHRAGEYGDRKWPGNCGGNLIKDLLMYFKPGFVFDPLCCSPHNGSSVAQSVMWRPAKPCRKALAERPPYAT